MTTDDPVRPTLLLRLEGEVKAAVLAEPQSIGFGLVVEDSKGEERRVKLTVADSPPVQVTLPPDLQGKRFKYALETKVPGREYELVVRLEPPLAVGPINESIALVLDHPRQKSLELRPSGTVGPRIGLEPPQLQMGQAPEGQPFHGSVRVQNRGSRLVKVLSAKAADPAVGVTVTEVVPGRSYELRLEAPAEFAPPAQGTPVEVKTDDPDRPVLTFPLLPRPKPPSSPALLVGKPAPPFSLKTVGGKELSNASATKKVTLLDFFAADCPHCKRQLPRLAAAVKSFEGQPVQLVLIAQKMRADFSVEQIRDVLKKSGVEPDAFDLVVDMTNAPGKAFLVNSYPVLVVLGKDGKVASAISGNADDLDTRLKGQVEALVAGKPIAPVQAQAAPTVQRAPAAARPAAKPATGTARPVK